MIEHVEERDGVYYVARTRISLDSVVYAFREGCSPETIRGDFDGLTLAHVYGAIAFYLDHQTEVDAYLLQRGSNGLSWSAREPRRVRICRRVLRVLTAALHSRNSARASEGFRRTTISEKRS
jgi:uncharacterized protein (DUF433 family)